MRLHAPWRKGRGAWSRRREPRSGGLADLNRTERELSDRDAVTAATTAAQVVLMRGNRDESSPYAAADGAERYFLGLPRHVHGQALRRWTSSTSGKSPPWLPKATRPGYGGRTRTSSEHSARTRELELRWPVRLLSGVVRHYAKTPIDRRRRSTQARKHVSRHKVRQYSETMPRPKIPAATIDRFVELVALLSTHGAARGEDERALGRSVHVATGHHGAGRGGESRPPD